MTPDLQAFLWASAKTAGLPIASSWVTHWLLTRTRTHIEGLEVALSIGSSHISPDAEDETPAAIEKRDKSTQEVPALLFLFTNRTQETVYLHRMTLSKVTAQLPVHPDSRMDIATKSYELKFREGEGQVYFHREMILQTNQTAITCICIAQQLPAPPVPKRSILPGRFFPQYFLLRYNVTVGKKAYRIATAY